MEVKLIKEESKNAFDVAKIKSRRTVRSDFLSDMLKKEDLKYLVNPEPESVHYLPATSKESQFVNEQNNCCQPPSILSRPGAARVSQLSKILQ